MELQTFINKNEDYLSELRRFNLKIKKYGDLGLAIITYKYDCNYEHEKYPFIKWCKGCVIDIKNNKIVCLPPVKAEKEYDLSNCNLNGIVSDINNYKIQPLLDGTMINLFFHNNEWMLSTRSFIGAKNKWDQNISFKKMFDESKENINYDELNKNNSYSFLLQHKNNRIVSMVFSNMIFLVDEYSFENNEIKKIDLKGHNYNSFVVIDDYDLNVLSKDINKKYNYYFKGYTLKNNEKRVNIINPQYQYVLNLKNKCNYNNKLLAFIYLRNNNLLKEYLNYFTEDTILFDNYRNKIYIMKNELHDCYIKLFITKKILLNDVPYQLKPLVYDLHNIYQYQQQKITNNVVNQYIYNMPVKKLCFVLNYYMR
jgi:hypothetical protein